MSKFRDIKPAVIRELLKYQSFLVYTYIYESVFAVYV